MVFPEWLRTCRSAPGLSQKRLAKALGMDQSTVARWEQGRHRPTKESLRKVQALFIEVHPLDFESKRAPGEKWRKADKTLGIRGFLPDQRSDLLSFVEFPRWTKSGRRFLRKWLPIS